MTRTHDANPWFSEAPRLVAVRESEDWDLIVGHGPVIATAIHDGHRMRPSLIPHLAISEQERRRDEDPLTGMLTSAGDVRLRVRSSRFQVDLNRPRDKALSDDPADTWGIRFWNGRLPDEELALAHAEHDRFYAMVTELIDAQVARWGSALLIDIHSYNHRRDGAEAEPADPDGNPDIELGITTLDPDRWGDTARRFAEALRRTCVLGRPPDVRANVRYPTGGHFPEWVYANWGDKVCTISPEYKKIHMDEWTGQVDIQALEDFRNGMERAVAEVRGDFLP
ncbi:N-formylglutamate amidohydrolase [Luteimonas notoginsengisoli]|uniref:N-formylglutamate amidohydrolase n=1 Tax=Luteimonas notoginsengisoli TaxID=1578200 RepID=A0ABV7UQT7_9GAMM